MDTIFVHFVSQCLSLKTLIEHTTVLAEAHKQLPNHMVCMPIKLKESGRVMLTRVTPEAADGYWQAKRAAAC